MATSVLCCDLQGKGEFTMEFKRYHPVLPSLQQEMVANYQLQRSKKDK